MRKLITIALITLSTALNAQNDITTFKTEAISFKTGDYWDNWTFHKGEVVFGEEIITVTTYSSRHFDYGLREYAIIATEDYFTDSDGDIQKKFLCVNDKGEETIITLLLLDSNVDVQMYIEWTNGYGVDFQVVLSLR